MRGEAQTSGQLHSQGSATSMVLAYHVDSFADINAMLAGAGS